MSTLRWGILGTGNIARQFCDDLRDAQRGEPVAVASRSRASATAFAAKYAIPHALEGYDALLARPDIDAVYLSLPNSLHHEWGIMTLRAGKHLLCEKPIALDADQGADLFREADAAGRVLIEAYMYRCHPQTLAVLDTIRSGAIGKVKLIRLSFCYRTRSWENNVRFKPELGGGAMMDVGGYCVSFACAIAQAAPTQIQAEALFHASGVDEQDTVTLRFPNQLVATFNVGMSVQADNTAYIYGERGSIEIPIPWKPPATGGAFTLRTRDDQGNEQVDARQLSPSKRLYAIEADAFAASVLDGAPPFVTREETLRTMAVLDEIRRQTAATRPLKNGRSAPV